MVKTISDPFIIKKLNQLLQHDLGKDRFDLTFANYG